MSPSAPSHSAAGTAKGNALKTFAVNFMLAFAGYVSYTAAKEWYQNRPTTKTTKP